MHVQKNVPYDFLMAMLPTVHATRKIFIYL